MSEQYPGEQPTQRPGLVRPFVGSPVAAACEPTVAVDGRIRPFLVTRGRTAGAEHIAVEAQVVITAAGLGARESLSFEYRDIVMLCEEPLAVAEIAAKLRLHLGVTRVLLGDLKQHGMVATFESGVDPAEDVDTILRVIDELRRRDS